MSDHVLDWIGAYHDGELSGDRLRQVTAHLHGCAACQAELAELSALSMRLQTSLPLPARTPPEQFVAQMGLRLGQRRPNTERARLRQITGLWLPLGVIGLWAAGQAVLAVSWVVLGVVWGASLPLALGTVDLWVLDLVFTAAAAGLLAGCLAGWWAARERETETGLAAYGEPAR